MKTCYKHNFYPFKSGVLYDEGIGCRLCKAEKEFDKMQDESLPCLFKKIIKILLRIKK
jgi:hypothetical protein